MVSYQGLEIVLRWEGSKLCAIEKRKTHINYVYNGGSIIANDQWKLSVDMFVSLGEACIVSKLLWLGDSGTIIIINIVPFVTVILAVVPQDNFSTYYQRKKVH